jgi:UDP-glucose 4-epimerase
MMVLVTGAHGLVGRTLVPRLLAAGYDVRASDLGQPVAGRPPPGAPGEYVRADLTDAASATALVRGCDAVVHTAAIAAPIHDPAHVVFSNNVLSTFNLLEAAIDLGCRQFINFSSESVPGFIFARKPFKPDYLPIDEKHPVRAQDPYALSKWVGELLCEQAASYAGIRCTSLRPASVQDENTYERDLGPVVRDASVTSGNYGAYIDVHDLCDAVVLAIETDLPGHEVFYIASPDTAGGHPLAETLRRHYDAGGVELRPLDRLDASPVSSEKARRLLGWHPSRSWRDYLNDEGRSRR